MRDHDHGSSERRTTLRRLHHELRTPIGQIMGYGEMLREEVLDRGLDDLVPDLDRIGQAAKRLLALVEEVLRPGAGVAPPSEVEAAGAAEPAAEAKPVAAPGASLLIVDDDPANRDLLARRLERAGYQVRAGGGGGEALRLVGEQAFDLVLLDVMMPEVSGIEVLEAIRRTHSSSELPVVMATALTGSEDVVDALRRGANDYVTKPFDLPVVLARVDAQLSLVRARREIEDLARQLEIRNAFIRRTFGRYVSDEIAESLLESQEGLDLSGEKRRVTILVADLRGFSSLTESLAPTQVVSILNNYLGSMAEVIKLHRGTIDEFIGDAILAFFGAPVAGEDDAERAVACAVAMQLAMPDVNGRNRERGLPEVEMGIGIATGEAIVGNLGSQTRSKYGAVGSPVNLASRIESYTLGGEILVSPATREAVAGVAHFDEQREVHPKGLDEPVCIHRVAGIGGNWGLELAEHTHVFERLESPVPVRFSILEGKQVSRAVRSGEIWARSASGAKIRCALALPELADLRLELPGRGSDGACYAKVVDAAGEDGGESFTLRFTSSSAALQDQLERALKASADPGPGSAS